MPRRRQPSVAPTVPVMEGDVPSQSMQEHSATAAHQASLVHPDQFQMFMTPREITTNYDPLEGDRQEHYDEREGELTGRSRTTVGLPNYRLTTAGRQRVADYLGGGTSQLSGKGYERNGYATESDEELYARKLEESQMGPREYREAHAGGYTPEPPGYNTLKSRASAPSGVRRALGVRGPNETTSDWNDSIDEADDYVRRKGEEHYDDQEFGPSLYDKIAEQGVLSPIHLTTDMPGASGRPQIAGGHHRLSAQFDIDPDQPIPVMHHRDFWEARDSGFYQ